MAKYSYTASNAKAETVSGTLHAESIASAQSALFAMGLMPAEIFESREDKSDSASTHRHPSQSGPVDWESVDERSLHTVLDSTNRLPPQSPHLQSEREREYFPIGDTLRLYAGWLLAWYFLVYALGGYQLSRSVPFRIPYVEAWLPPYSPLILTFACGSFLYLLMTQIHAMIGGGRLKGFLLSITGIVCFVLYRINV